MNRSRRRVTAIASETSFAEPDPMSFAAMGGAPVSIVTIAVRGEREINECPHETTELLKEQNSCRTP